MKSSRIYLAAAFANAFLSGWEVREHPELAFFFGGMTLICILMANQERTSK